MGQENCAIPRKIHQIWIGNQEIPEHCVAFSKEMREMHPNWEYKLWRHEEIFDDLYKKDTFLQNYRKEPNIYKWAFITDRIRLLLLRDFGGIYCDLDAKPIRPFDTIIDGLNSNITFFAGMKPSQNNNTLIDCTVYGSAPNSRIIQECLNCYVSTNWAHGCKTFNDRIIEKMDSDVALFGYEYFYNWQISDKTIVLHDVEETRLFSWVDGLNKTKEW